MVKVENWSLVWGLDIADSFNCYTCAQSLSTTFVENTLFVGELFFFDESRVHS